MEVAWTAELSGKFATDERKKGDWQPTQYILFVSFVLLPQSETKTCMLSGKKWRKRAAVGRVGDSA